MKNYVNNFQNNLIGTMNSMSNIFQDKMSNDIIKYIEQSMARVYFRYNKRINLHVNIPSDQYYNVTFTSIEIFQYGLRVYLSVQQKKQDPNHNFFQYTNEYLKSFEKQNIFVANGTGDKLYGSINYDLDGLIRFRTLENVVLNNTWIISQYGSYIYGSYNFNNHDNAF